MKIARKVSKKIREGLEQWNLPIHLTAKGVEHLRAKLERLQARIPHLISESARTAAYGDRSENAEYKEAKGALRRTYRQIANLEDQLKRVVVIAPKGASAVVELGSAVTVELNGSRRTFEILGPQESDPSRGRISYESPLGAALMGRARGDVTEVHTTRGVQKYRVIAIA